MSDRELSDTANFEAMAYGIFEAAPDTNSGREALLAAYSENYWTDEPAAKEALEYYGQAIKFKTKDQSRTQNINEAVPFALEDIDLTGITNMQDAYTKWEKTNTDYLKDDPEPMFLVQRQQLLNDIKEYASFKRREENQADIEADEYIGKDSLLGKAGQAIGIPNLGGGLVNLGATALKTAVTGIEPWVNATVNTMRITEDYELNTALTELTNPLEDESLLSDLAGVTGSVMGFIGAGALGGPVSAILYGITQGVDATLTRREETFKRTGDESAADEATVWEGAGQAVGLYADKFVFGKVIKRGFGKAAKDILKKEAYADKLVFGRVNKRGFGKAAKDTLKKEAIEGAVAEGSAESTQQIATNIAENIESSNDRFAHVLRGTGRAAALGALAAGTVTVGAHKFPSQGNTNARVEEIEEFGKPLTPVTKQVVGKINPDTSYAEDPFSPPPRPTETEQTAENKEEGISDTKDVFYVDKEGTARTELEAEPEPKPVAFTDEQGKDWVQTAPNQYAEAGDPRPHDTAVFISEGEARKVATAIMSGKGRVVLTEAGPAIKYEDPDIRYERINFSTSPSVDSYVLPISETKIDSQGNTILPVGVPKKIIEIPEGQSVTSTGQRIRTVGGLNDPTSMGAMRRERQEKQMSYGARMEQTASMPIAMKAIGSELFYEPFVMANVSQEANDYVMQHGIEGAGQFLRKPTTDREENILKGQITTYLHNFFSIKQQEAEDAGDTDLYDKLTDAAAAVIPPGATHGSGAGQILRAHSGKQGLDPLESGRASNRAYKAELVQAGKEEGVDPLVIGQSAEKLVAVTKAIESQKAVAEREEALDITAINPEAAAIAEEVTTIEEEAQEKVAEDLENISKEEADITEEVATIEKKAVQAKEDIETLDKTIAEEVLNIEGEAQEKIVDDKITIDNETRDIKEEVATIEKKAERAKRKDIETLENAIAVDSGALVEALTDATDLKGATVEETAKLEKDVNESLEAASEKASQEITKAVGEERLKQEKLLTDIDEEIAKTETVIDKTIKQATRRKKKDIALVESAIAEDSEKLVNAVNAGIKLKEVTAEEALKIEEEVNKAIAQASAKASIEVAKGVKEERDNKEREKKSRLEQSEDTLLRAEVALEDKRDAAKVQLKNLKIREAELERNGKNTDAVVLKQIAIEDALTRAEQRLNLVRANHEQLVKELEEKAQSAEDLAQEEFLKDLESGIEIQVEPAGKSRYIRVKTKRNKTDITKLFNNKRSEAFAPLSALSRSVNDLAGILRQSRGARNVNNSQITLLQNRINANQEILGNIRQQDSVSGAVRKQVDTAQKRLKELLTTKAQSTPSQEQEALLDDLESGIEIRTVPVGKRRVITVKTKQTGRDITKLFNNKKSEAFAPLSALSRSVNELAGTVRQSLGARAVNNERISTLQKRIDENKTALEKRKTLDSLNATEKSKIAAAKKRLAELEKTKGNLTLESRIPKNKKEKYKKFKERLDTIGKEPKTDAIVLSEAEKEKIKNAKKRLAELDKAKAEATTESRIPKNKKEKYKKFKKRLDAISKEPRVKSDALKAAEANIKKLENAKTKLERLAKRRAKAKQKALEAAKALRGRKAEITRLQAIIDDHPDLTKDRVYKIKRDIIVLESVDAGVKERINLFGMWASNQIGSGISGILAGLQGVQSVIVDTPAAVVADVISTAYDVVRGQSLEGRTYQSPAYLKGLSDAGARERAVGLAKIAFFTGKRLRNFLTREETSVTPKFFKSGQEHALIGEDAYEQMKVMKFNGDPLHDFGVAVAKASGYGSMPFLRILAVAEALTWPIRHSAMDRQGAAYYFNKKKSLPRVTEAEIAETKEGLTDEEFAKYRDTVVTEEELATYQYNSKENWEFAKAYAKNQSEELRKAGIDVSKDEEFFSAMEKFQNMSPRAVQVSAVKQASELVANGPASGMVGAASDLVNTLVGYIPGGKFLVAFINSIAHFANFQLSLTPLGALDVIGRTDFERNVIRARALTWTGAGVAFLAIRKAQKEKDPNYVPWFDVVSDDGGYTYKFKLGDVFLNTKDSPFALWALAIGKSLDKMKVGKEVEPVTFTSVLYASAMLGAQAAISFPDSMAMLKGPVDIIRALDRSIEGKPDSQAELLRSLLQPLKGFVPAASALRLATHTLDNPIVGKKDIASAIVEGWPILQSRYGRPALNQLGEVMKKGFDNPDIGLYRIFSTKPKDIDLRWLSNNNYELPNINTIPFSKKSLEMVAEGIADTDELNYAVKHEAYQRAARDGQLREIVRDKRLEYGTSARSEKVQEQISRKFRAVIAQHIRDIIKGDGKYVGPPLGKLSEVDL